MSEIICASFNATSGFDPDQDPLRAAISVAYFVLGIIHIVLALGVFFVAFEVLPGEHIKKRPRALVIMTALGVLFHMIVSFVDFAISPVPSWVSTALSILIVPVVSIPIPIKLFDFYAKVIFARAVVEVSIDAVDIAEPEESIKALNLIVTMDQVAIRPASESSNTSLVEGSAVRRPETFQTGTHPQSLRKSDLSQTRSLRLASGFGAPELGGRQSSMRTKANQVFLEDARKKKVISHRELLFLRFLASPRFKLIFLCLYFSPFIGVIIANYVLVPGLNPVLECYGAGSLPYNSTVIIISGVISIVLGVIGALSVRKFYDPLMISRECRWYLQYGGMIALISYAVGAETSISIQGFTFDFLTSLGLHLMLFTVTELQVIIAYRMLPKDLTFEEMQNQYFQERKRRREHHESTLGRSSTRDSNLGNKVSEDPTAELIDFLNTPANVELFEKYLIGEFSAEMLRMYIECRSWERSYFDSSDTTKRARARRIASLFVETGSVFEANLPSKVREEILTAIQNSASGPPLSASLFKKSQMEMLRMMYGPFRRFIKTPDYLNHKPPQHGGA